MKEWTARPFTLSPIFVSRWQPIRDAHNVQTKYVPGLAKSIDG